MAKRALTRNISTRPPVVFPAKQGVEVLLRLPEKTARLIEFFAPPDGVDEWVSKAIIYYVDNALVNDDAAISKLEAAVEKLLAKFMKIEGLDTKLLKVEEQLSEIADNINKLPPTANKE